MPSTLARSRRSFGSWRKSSTTQSPACSVISNSLSPLSLCARCRMSAARSGLQIAAQEARQHVTVDEFERCRAGAVVAARQGSDLVRQFTTRELVDQRPGEVDGERQIVSCIDEQ